MKRLVLSVLVASLFVGCATVRTTDNYHGVRVENGDEPLETVEVENSGWELFKCLPLASGNPNFPNKNTCRWFMNTVTLQNNIEMLDQEMKSCGATRFANLTSRNTEETFLFILLTRRAYHTSAVLLKDDPAPKAATSEKSTK